MQALPEARPDDAEDVVWGLQTAAALFGRGEFQEAIVWVRRAASAALEAGHGERAQALKDAAANLERGPTTETATSEAAKTEPTGGALPRSPAAASEPAPTQAAKAPPTKHEPIKAEIPRERPQGSLSGEVTQAWDPSALARPPMTSISVEIDEAPDDPPANFPPAPRVLEQSSPRPQAPSIRPIAPTKTAEDRPAPPKEEDRKPTPSVHPGALSLKAMLANAVRRTPTLDPWADDLDVNEPPPNTLFQRAEVQAVDDEDVVTSAPPLDVLLRKKQLPPPMKRLATATGTSLSPLSEGERRSDPTEAKELPAKPPVPTGRRGTLIPRADDTNSASQSGSTRADGDAAPATLPAQAMHLALGNLSERRSAPPPPAPAPAQAESPAMAGHASPLNLEESAASAGLAPQGGSTAGTRRSSPELTGADLSDLAASFDFPPGSAAEPKTGAAISERPPAKGPSLPPRPRSAPPPAAPIAASGGQPSASGMRASSPALGASVGSAPPPGGGRTSAGSVPPQRSAPAPVASPAAEPAPPAPSSSVERVPSLSPTLLTSLGNFHFDGPADPDSPPEGVRRTSAPPAHSVASDSPPPTLAAASLSGRNKASDRAAPAANVGRSSRPAAGSVRPQIGDWSLSEVDAFADLPSEVQRFVSEKAERVLLGRDEEVPVDGATLLLRGRATVCSALSDAVADVVKAGELVSSLTTQRQATRFRVVATEPSEVATWKRADLEAALATCPWVRDDLRKLADLRSARCGATLGGLGEVDEQLRELVFSKLALRLYDPSEVVGRAGEELPGLLIVGSGELVEPDGGEFGPGDVVRPEGVFAHEKLTQAIAAGAEGAMVLHAKRNVALELISVAPALVELLRLS